MGSSGEDNQYSSCLHVSLDASGDSSSVSSLILTLHAQAHNQVSFGAHIHGFTDSQLEEADEMFDKYGPTPRICIDFVNNPDISVQYKELYIEATKGLLLDRYLDVYSKGKMFDMDELTQTVFLLVPEVKAGGIHIHHRLEPITHALNTRFQKEVGEEFGGGKRIRPM